MDLEERPPADEIRKWEHGEFIALRNAQDGRKLLKRLFCLLLSMLLAALLGLAGLVDQSTSNATTAGGSSPLPHDGALGAAPLLGSHWAVSDTTPILPCSFPSSTPTTIPVRLAIYYGYPSLVNGCEGDLDCATAAFCEFDLVVLGDGLEHPIHPDHDNTAIIINNLKTRCSTEVYGYCDLGVTTQNLPIETIRSCVDEWAEMGVAGIFLDDAGRDFGVDRDRLCDAVNYVHDKGLSVFVNAWNPDDVFADDPPGTPTCLREGDWYLAESHPVSNGQCGALDFWWEKSKRLLCYRHQTGVSIATMSTGDNSSCSDWPNCPPFRQALWATYLFGFDAFGFTNPQYSAYGDSANRLCFLPSFPINVGTMYLTLPTGPVTTSGVPTYWRLTDKGTIYVFDGDNTTCDGTCIYPSLTVTKQADPSPVQDGSPLTYTLRITNTSMVTLTAIITDILPSEVIPTRVLTWTPTITAPGGTWVQQFVVNVQTGYTGPLVNVVEVTSQEGASGSRASATVCVNVCKIYLPIVLKNYSP
jgi:uncharacterized repeat protein (TIGR01451 family)